MARDGQAWSADIVRRCLPPILCTVLLTGFAGALRTSSAAAADPVIAAAGDIACSPSSSNYNGGAGTADKCRMKYTSDLLVNQGLSAVLVLGDAQYDTAKLSSFQKSYDPTWGRVKSITRPAAGNHEYKTTGAAGYFDYFNGVGVQTGPAGDRSKGYYSFNVGTWHLIALNSTDHCTIISCAAGSAQEQWLKADLAANADKYCTLAYWHDPRFNSGHDGNADEMAALFKDLYDADADLVLGGHAHDYERFAPQNPSGQLDTARGIRQFVVGTGGAFWTSISTPKPNSQIRQNSTYGVLKVTLRPTSYDWQFVPESGKSFTDSGTGQCHGSSAPPPSDTTKPTAPTSLSATAGSGQISLNWNASTDNVGVTGYKVYRGGSEIASIGATTSYTDTTVAPSTTYSYTVRAVDAAGNLSDPSNTASATTSAATSLTIAPEADALVNAGAATTNYATAKLRTDGGSTPEESFLRFTVGGVSGAVQSAKLRVFAYTATADGPAVYTTSNSWSESTITWNTRPLPTSTARDDKGAIATNTWAEFDVTPFVTGNGTYSFVLAQTTTDGVDYRSREYSSNRPELVLTVGTDSQKPTPPGNLQATAGAGQVALTWNASSDNVGVTGYRVFRGPTQIASLGGSATSYTDTGLVPGSYSYTVRAIDAAGNLSDPSNTASATVVDTTPPTVPQNLTATVSGAKNVDLAWNASSDNVGVTGYQVYRGAQEIANLGPTATAYKDTNLPPGPYSYRVRALDAAGNPSAFSDPADVTVPDTTKPTAPRNLDAAPNGSTQADLTWEESTDDVAVTAYRIYRDGQPVATVDPTTSYSDTVLPGTYVYEVRALDAADNLSDPSNSDTATVTPPDVEAPTPPANLTATVNGTQVDLAWDASTDNVGVTGYQIYRDGLEIASIGPATSYADTVPPGTYEYVVRAVDGAGNPSDPSNPAQAVVPDTEKPSAPANLSATAVSASQIDLAWDASADNVSVTAYEIYRDDLLLATVGPATAYSDSVVAPATHTYVVRALDAAGNRSDPSNSATATVTPPDLEPPSPPANLTGAMTSSGDVELTWDAATDNVAVTGYRVFRDTTEIASVGALATTYTDVGPDLGLHSYAVRAVDEAGNISDPSNTADVTVTDVEAPTAPGNLTATAVSPSQIDLTWDAAFDNVAVTAYEIHRDGFLLTTIGATTSYSDNVLAPATHTYEVRALDAAGNRSGPSNSATATVTPPDTEAPTPPGNLQAAGGPGRVDLSWEASFDGVGVTAYHIYRDGQFLTSAGATTSYADTNLAPGTYDYEVRAVDGAGNVSDPSNSATATVPDVEAPSAPANLVATAAGAGQVDLTWDAASDNVLVTGYRVYRGSEQIASLGVATTFSDTGRPPGDYTYTVRALDAAGNLSAPSNEAGVTLPDTTKPTAPGTLTATAVSSTRIDLSWGASVDDVGVTGYRIYRGGGLLATVGPTTSYSDTTVTGGSTYSYEVRAEDGAGQLSDPSNTATATTPAPTVNLTLAPEADAEVNAGAATTNYATAKLRADGGSTPEESYLRFTVEGVEAGTVRSAKLRMYAYTATADGPAVFTTATNWSETTVNWNNRPARTSTPIDDKGAIASASWVEFDVTPFVTGSGTYSFGVASTSSDGVDFRSREYTSNRPELVVSAGPPDTQQPSAPSSLTAAASPGSVDLAWEPSTDNVGVIDYRVYREGSLLDSAGGATSYTDTSVTAESTYTYLVRAEDGAGNLSTASNTVTATTPAPPAIQTLAPEADARVHEGSPDTNYATSYLRANGGTELDVETFLRFTVSEAPAGVQSATLRVFAYSGTVDGPAVYETDAGWSETSVSWNTRPARTGGAVDDKGAIPKNSWVEYDVTPFVTGNGTYSFALVSASGDGVHFRSREYAADRPELVVALP